MTVVIIVSINIIVIGIINNFPLRGKTSVSLAFHYFESQKEKEREREKIERHRPRDAAECV